VIEGNELDFVGPDGFVDVIALADAHTTREDAMRDAEGLVRRRTGEMIRRLKDRYQ